MKIDVTPRFIAKLVKEWESEDTQEMVEAIVAELKKDCREALRRSYGHRDEVQAWYDGMIGQAQNQEFWEQVDHILNFSFEY